MRHRGSILEMKVPLCGICQAFVSQWKLELCWYVRYGMWAKSTFAPSRPTGRTFRPLADLHLAFQGEFCDRIS
jgi:hypothetical protein